MCQCVFRIYVLKIAFERWFWELKMLIGSLVELHAWLHSSMCFSFLEKLFLSNLDTSSTPGYLSSSLAISYRNLDTSSIVRWIDRESSWILNSFSTAGGSIELLFMCLLLCISTPSRQLHLSTPFYSTPLFVEITEPQYIGSMRFGFHFSRSLSG